MILFHHLGEELIPALVAAGAVAGPTLLLLRTGSTGSGDGCTANRAESRTPVGGAGTSRHPHPAHASFTQIGSGGSNLGIRPR